MSAFDAWLESFFAAFYKRHPVNATFIGIHDYDDQLPDLSLEGTQSLVNDAEDLLGRLHSLPAERLHEAQALDRELAEGFLIIQRWEAESPHFGANPIHFTGEAVFGLVSLLLRDFAPLSERFENAKARLHAVPDLLEVGAHRISSAPRAWIVRARHECAGAQLLLADVADEYPQLGDATTQASEAFAKFDRVLGEEVIGTDDYGCGSEALDLILHHAHFSEKDAAGVERLAFERIAEEERVLSATPPPTDPPQTSRGEYLTRFASVSQRTIGLARERNLLSVPDWPVRFVERPRWAQRAAPYLYFLPYRSPAPYDAAPVVEYLVPPGSDDATIKLNHVIHHASLGHHFQNWFAAHAASRIGQIAAVDCASRIAMLCGGTMAEGWANYAVDLAEEAGFLTPAERYAQHRTRLRMAARAIVDIRLHQRRISLDDATRFYAERTGMSPEAALAEAVKNSLFPGAACMYLMGWDGIWRLRRELLEVRHGSRFTVREFHDQFLSFGSIPVSLVARAMLGSATLAAQP